MRVIVRKVLVSLAVLISVVSCSQTEIETPLYEQPKRRINAQKMGTYMGSVNTPQVYNNPAMAGYTIPGQSLSAVGQQYQPMNLNGQMSPWSYMPPPSGANMMNEGAMNGGMMPPQMPGQPQGFPSQGAMGQQPQFRGGTMPPSSALPPVQYGTPPMQGGGNPYGSPTIPMTNGGQGMGGGGMPPYNNLPSMQAPFPPQGGGFSPNPPQGYPDYPEQRSSVPPKLNSGAYSPLREDDYDFDDEDGDDLFSFFDTNGNANQQLADISDVQEVGTMPVILPQSEQAFADTPSAYQQQPLRPTQPIIDEQQYTSQPPKSISYRNIYQKVKAPQTKYYRAPSQSQRRTNQQAKRVYNSTLPTALVKEKNIQPLNWRDAPRSASRPKSLANNSPIRRTYYPRTKYREDYAPIQTRNYGTWYPKSMTRI